MLHNRYDCHERIDTLSLGKLYIPASILERTGWVMRNVENPETVAQHQMDAALLVVSFREKMEKLGVNILTIQDILLIHDIAESDPRVGDITPHCNISGEEKREREELAINEMLYDNPNALRLWYDYEDGRTKEGELAKEFDKLQAIAKARFYEDTQGKIGLTNIFYTHSVVKKGQINTDFLFQHAVDLYENKPR